MDDHPRQNPAYRPTRFLACFMGNGNDLLELFFNRALGAFDVTSRLRTKPVAITQTEVLA